MKKFNINDLKSGKTTLPVGHNKGVFAAVREELKTILTQEGEAILLYDFLKESKVMKELSTPQQKYNYTLNAVRGSGKEFKVVKKDGRNLVVKVK